MLLEKMLQSQGFGSRKFCQQLIKDGAVRIDKEVIRDLKFKVEPENLNFYVNNHAYIYREKVYIALNKPKGMECSHNPQHHLSVFSLFDQLLKARALKTVGRLDQDTTGLLLITDDGSFVHALTHPKKHIPKTYLVTTADPITEAQILELENGVALNQETGVFAATDIQQKNDFQISMNIDQGIYHQVKRMLAAVGHRVTHLHRQAIGPLVLSDLKEGEWVYLNAEQVQAAKDKTILKNSDKFQIRYHE